MRAVEFIVELSEKRVVAIPDDVAAQLPRRGRVRVIILSADESEDSEWRAGAYEQFVHEDPPEDSVYDSYR